jgi:hypothetical protein
MVSEIMQQPKSQKSFGALIVKPMQGLGNQTQRLLKIALPVII